MTKAELETIVARRGLKIDGTREGAGKFRDIQIGIGADRHDLESLVIELKAGGLDHAAITRVTNTTHIDHGKLMIEIPSFWYT